MLEICRWMDQNTFFMAINASAPLSVVLEAVHYLSFFIVVGSIGIVDLYVLGVAGRNRNVAQLAQDLLPWMWVGVVLNVLSGLIMFTGEATAYYLCGPFRIKVFLVFVAIVFGIVVQQSAAKWSELPAIPAGPKVVAFISLALWIGAIIGGVQTPAICNTG